MSSTPFIDDATGTVIPEAASRPWRHLSVVRPSPGHWGVTFDLPAEDELAGPLTDFRELLGRPAQQANLARLEALGLNSDSDLERSLGRHVVDVIQPDRPGT
jgi:hypothetical protein